jgi:rhodanese-related sulfurtransferase
MSGVEFQAAIAAHPGAIVIDVRTPREFASGHIKGARNLDIQGTGFVAAVAKLDPTKTYFVYCRSGARSSAAVSVMQKHGLMNLFELAGGAMGSRQLMTSR